MEKIKKLKEYLVEQDISWEELLSFAIDNDLINRHFLMAKLTEKPMVRDASVIKLSMMSFPLIQVGMIWYEGNEFSFAEIEGKKKRAVVELVKDGFIYGDLTVGDDIKICERKLPHKDAKEYIAQFSDICDQNECVILGTHEILGEMCKMYSEVDKTLLQMKKMPRRGCYWSSSSKEKESAVVVYFRNGSKANWYEHDSLSVRPVLMKKVV